MSPRITALFIDVLLVFHWWTMGDSLNSVIHAPESIMHQLMWVSQSKLLMLSKNRVSVTIDNSAIVSMISWLLMPIPLLLTTMTLLRIWEMRLIQKMTNVGEFWEWVETPWICECMISSDFWSAPSAWSEEDKITKVMVMFGFLQPKALFLDKVPEYESGDGAGDAWNHSSFLRFISGVILRN